MDFVVFLVGAIAVVLAVIVIFSCCLFSSSPYAIIREIKGESKFHDPDTMQYYPFPTIHDPPTRSLSVIVPAYNEQERLPPMLDECLSYLKERHKVDSKFTFEVIVVDDGSSDDTSEVALKYSLKHSSDLVRVLTLRRNRGKGGAVRLGMLSARGELLLFADADGATKFSDFSKLEQNMLQICSSEKDVSGSLGVVCGSRAHLEEESVAVRSFFRTVLMYGFHLLVRLFTVRTVRDTQCGFKLFTRRTAAFIFQNLHVERWAFDVEMLYMAEALGLPVGEVAVRWTEIEGSKVTPVLSWVQMGKDILVIWLKYTLGAWRFRPLNPAPTTN